MKGPFRIAIGVVALLTFASAFAHHSGAMFDDKQSITLTGSVKAFQWTNPHCWIQLLVSDNGPPVEWSIELGSPSQSCRGGLRPSSLTPGDKITVVLHPLRDGSKGGMLVSAIGSDGKPIG